MRRLRWSVCAWVVVLGAGMWLGESPPRAHALGTLWAVCDDGQWDFTDIQSAIDSGVVANGDGIRICGSPNPYAGFIDTAKNLTFSAFGTGAVTVTGTGPIITIGATGAPTQPTVTLNKLTITGAYNVSGAGKGGGVYNYGTLTVVSSTIHHNTAHYGGGIENDHGTLAVDRSSVVSNNAHYINQF